MIWILPQADTGADAFAGAGAGAATVAASGAALSAAALTFLPMPRIFNWESSKP